MERVMENFLIKGDLVSVRSEDPTFDKVVLVMDKGVRQGLLWCDGRGKNKIQKSISWFRWSCFIDAKVSCCWKLFNVSSEVAKDRAFEKFGIGEDDLLDDDLKTKVENYIKVLMG